MKQESKPPAQHNGHESGCEKDQVVKVGKSWVRKPCNCSKKDTSENNP